MRGVERAPLAVLGKTDGDADIALTWVCGLVLLTNSENVDRPMTFINSRAFAAVPKCTVFRSLAGRPFGSERDVLTARANVGKARSVTIPDAKV
jgi:hypothetical protein